jgi:hypothetical protein
LAAKTPTRATLIYFHGNAEDVQESKQILKAFQENINVNIFAIEYPGYGVYKGKVNEKVL